ncbi:MAG: DUF2099 family protein [Methanolinea sp.]|nr:DUF2099 family protein [Methanolinea sp.]
MAGDGEDEHVVEAIGRARVVIRGGKVVSVGEPLIWECPLARRFGKPVHPITPEAIRENMEYRIRAFGMCTPDRIVEARGDYVDFGASELLACGLESGLLSCAVIACDGAGSVIVSSPSLVQGIGGRMSGLVKTSPIAEVIQRIREKGGIVYDPARASVDQPGAVRVARAAGHERIGVTVTSATDALSIRRDFPGALVIAVHTTGVSEEDARVLVRNADIVTACASRHVRELAGPVALLQAGVSIPVFAVTPAGKDLVLEKVRRSPSQVLVKSARLPFTLGDEPRPLV